MQRVTLLGVPVDAVTMDEAVRRILTMLGGGPFDSAHGKKHHVMTPNSEMLVEASRNSAFRAVLQHADLNLPDSAGLLWAARRTGQVLPERVTGVDVVTNLCAKLDAEHPVFLLGGRSGVGRRASEVLKKKNPRLVIAGTYEGSPSEEDAAQIITRINDSGAHLLLVAYGAPKQDLWINQNFLSLTSVSVAIGVGGTFDFIAGHSKRAPRVVQSMGLEWLWRLTLEPWRFNRILTAVVRFPILLLRFRKNSP